MKHTWMAAALVVLAASVAVAQGGKWVEISYGRPIKRGRDLFGSGATYGKELTAGSGIWRAGANQTTTLTSEVPLVIGGKTLAAGTEYYLLIELKQNAWTLIVTTQTSQKKYDPANKADLWGSYNYKPDHDVVRVPMALATGPMSIDELTWAFTDVTAEGGTITLMWDKHVASVPFKVAN